MTYSPKHAKQFYLQGFTERRSIAGKATNKIRELKLRSLVYPFAVWFYFFLYSKALPQIEWEQHY